jgi:hypothetical protein
MPDSSGEALGLQPSLPKRRKPPEARTHQRPILQQSFHPQLHITTWNPLYDEDHNTLNITAHDSCLTTSLGPGRQFNTYPLVPKS